MLKHLKIFAVEKVGGTIVVLPMGDASSFRYYDLHREANTVRDVLMKPDSRHLVLDLTGLSYFGSEFIGSLISMAREVRNRGGQAVMCSASDQMKEVLQNMSLFKLWPYYETREEALRALAELSPSETPSGQ